MLYREAWYHIARCLVHEILKGFEVIDCVRHDRLVDNNSEARCDSLDLFELKDDLLVQHLVDSFYFYIVQLQNIQQKVSMQCFHQRANLLPVLDIHLMLCHFDCQEDL